MNAETLALFLAGLAAPYLANLVKGQTSGAWAVWLALGVSVVCAAVALLLTGGLTDALTDPTRLIERFGAVFALSTLIYKSWPGGVPTATETKPPHS